MKARYIIKRLFLGVLFLGALFLCITPSISEAGEQVDSVKSTDGTCDMVLVEELNKRIGGWVCVTLNSGKTFCGVVMKERDGLAHLAKVQEKEFSDVLVRISDISSLGVRFRAAKKKRAN